MRNWWDRFGEWRHRHPNAIAYVAMCLIIAVVFAFGQQRANSDSEDFSNRIAAEEQARVEQIKEESARAATALCERSNALTGGVKKFVTESRDRSIATLNAGIEALTPRQQAQAQANIAQLNATVDALEEVFPDLDCDTFAADTTPSALTPEGDDVLSDALVLAAAVPG